MVNHLLAPGTCFSMFGGRGVASDPYRLTMLEERFGFLAQCQGLPGEDSVNLCQPEALASGPVLMMFNQTNAMVGYDEKFEMRSCVYDPLPNGKRRYHYAEASPPFCISEAIAASLQAGDATVLVIANRPRTLVDSNPRVVTVSVNGELLSFAADAYVDDDEYEPSTLCLVRGTRLVFEMTTYDASFELTAVDQANSEALSALRALAL